MDNMTWILTGGFAKGYRTYILAAIGIASAVAKYSLGDMDLVSTIQAVAVSASIGTARAALPPAK